MGPPHPSSPRRTSLHQIARPPAGGRVWRRNPLSHDCPSGGPGAPPKSAYGRPKKPATLKASRPTGRFGKLKPSSAWKTGNDRNWKIETRSSKIEMETRKQKLEIASREAASIFYFPFSVFQFLISTFCSLLFSVPLCLCGLPSPADPPPGLRAIVRVKTPERDHKVSRPGSGQ